MKSCFLLIFILFSNYSLLIGQWIDVNQGTDSRVSAFYVDSAINKLYVGGSFEHAGNININNIALWDGVSWSIFGSNELFSSPGYVTSIISFNGEIIVGGDFDSIGNEQVNNIAKWNGSNWESIGKGFDQSVQDLIVYQGELYACRFFAYSDTNFVECVAKWNGIYWERVAHLIGYANTFSIYQGKLIIGGSFFDQNASNLRGIIGWDGLNIDTTMGGFNNYVFKLRNINDTLIAVGSFTGSSNNPSSYISLYFNNAWHSIGNPTGGSNWVKDVIKFHNSLYFVGYFSNPPDICRYNGVGFDSLGEALGYLERLVEYQGRLYIGGLFNDINGIPYKNIVIYDDMINFIADNKMESSIKFDIPNPISSTEFSSKILEACNANTFDIQIISLLGEEIFSYLRSKKYSLRNSFNSSITPGLYLLKIVSKNNSISFQKIIVE